MNFINIMWNNHFVIYAFAFFGMLISNLFPIMFFFFPEIVITSSVYIVKEWNISIYVVFLFCLFWAIIWETTSYFIGKHINKDKLYKYFWEERVKKIESIFLTHHKKSIIIWKMLPRVTRIVPVFFGFIRYDFKRFFMLNSLMIIYSLTTSMISLFVGFAVFDYYFKDYSFYLFIILIIIFVFPHIYKKFGTIFWQEVKNSYNN
jgi:membrane protein DedA with SNARE-associated domain